VDKKKPRRGGSEEPMFPVVRVLSDYKILVFIVCGKGVKCGGRQYGKSQHH
jgi:hypothetical protein